MARWRISGAVNYSFPNGTMLRSDRYLVIAEDPATLTAIQFRVRQSATDVSWTAEVSTDLLNWNDGPGFTVQVGPPVDNGDGTQTLIVRSLQAIAPGTPRQFLRLQTADP
jgi:hypothetical protein